MKFFAKAVATGFALALGSALFKKAAPYIGFDDKKAKSKDEPDVNTADGATDPGLRRNDVYS
jgi:hypothetical protein